MTILIIGPFGGRIDQEMKSYDSLLSYHNQFNRILLVNNQNIAYILDNSFHHLLYINNHIEGPICGLIPIYGKVSNISTSGLKWNLNHHELEFGKLISSSNQIIKETTDYCLAKSMKPDVFINIENDNKIESVNLNQNLNDVKIVEVDTNHYVLWTNEINPEVNISELI